MFDIVQYKETLVQLALTNQLNEIFINGRENNKQLSSKNDR
jgi:hypothetical protein